MPYCAHCGSQVDERALACPECGQRIWNRPAPVRRTEPLATASLVTGVASLLICPFVGSIAAIVMGVSARGRISRNPSSEGAGLATGGIVTGVLGVLWGALLVGMLIAFVPARFAEDAEQIGFGHVEELAVPADADRRAQSSLRNALTAAKTIYVDNETYEEATVQALSLAEPTLLFVDDDPSPQPNVVSVFVVGPHEIRLASRSESGTCFVIRDMVGPDVDAGPGTSFARLDGVETCRASLADEALFGPSW